MSEKKVSQMGVTIHDVAKKAGVSHTTVSWTIHNHPGITDATKEKVFRAIKELDYHPNYLARSLVKGKTNTIAVVSSFFSSPFEMEVLKGIEQSIVHDPRGTHSITLFSALNRDEEVLKEIVYGKRADAAILLSIRPSEEIISLFSRNNMPLVVVDELASEAITLQVDNYRGAYIATEYLIQRGRKRIGLILGTDNGNFALSQSERKRGYIQALNDHGYEFDENLVFLIEDYYFEEGQIVFKRMLKKGINLDGVFCAAGDLVAMGFMLEARNMNVELPEQLSVIGYDDIPSSALVWPALTTIKQPLMLIGKRSYEEVTEALEAGTNPSKTVMYDPQLVIRQSV